MVEAAVPRIQLSFDKQLENNISISMCQDFK